MGYSGGTVAIWTPELAVSRLSLAQRFLIWSLFVLVLGMTGIGLWVSHQIEQGIIHRTASTTALYVDSLIAEPLQELATSGTLGTQINTYA